MTLTRGTPCICKYINIICCIICLVYHLALCLPLKNPSLYCGYLYHVFIFMHPNEFSCVLLTHVHIIGSVALPVSFCAFRSCQLFACCILFLLDQSLAHILCLHHPLFCGNNKQSNMCTVGRTV